MKVFIDQEPAKEAINSNALMMMNVMMVTTIASMMQKEGSVSISMEVSPAPVKLDIKAMETIIKNTQN